jgi:hypothetical protein
MIKKLVLSGLTVGIVGAALSYGVYAYFFTGTTTAVDVTAADGLDVTYDIDVDCDSSYEATGLADIPATTSVGPAYPGDTDSACVRVNNNNPTDIDVHLKNDSVTDDAGLTFVAVLYAKVDNVTEASAPCPYALVGSGTYTSGRGCLVANIDPNSSEVVKATILFYDDSTDQSALAGKVATWNSNLDAYTTPAP